MLFAFVVLGLVSSVLRQDIGWEECLQNELLFVEWDELNQSINHIIFCFPDITAVYVHT